MVEFSCGRQPVPQGRLNPADLLRPIGVKKQIDAGQSGSAGERVAHEGRAMHKDPGVTRGNGIAHVPGCQRCCEAHIATGQSFAKAHDVGCNSRVLAGEQLAGATKSGCDFIKD